MQIGCWVILVSLAVVSAALMFATSVVYASVLREVNDLRPVDQRIRGGDNTKVFYVLRTHSAALHDSTKPRLLVVLGLSGLVAFLAFFISAIACSTSQV